MPNFQSNVNQMIGTAAVVSHIAGQTATGQRLREKQELTSNLKSLAKQRAIELNIEASDADTDFGDLADYAERHGLKLRENPLYRERAARVFTKNFDPDKPYADQYDEKQISVYPSIERWAERKAAKILNKEMYR